MPIDYTVVTNPLTTPQTFRPEVVTRQTVSLRSRAARAATETAQNGRFAMPHQFP